MKPEEDRMLSRCKHEWVDLIGGGGISKHDPMTALSTFFCKFCLEIRVKSYNQSRFYLSKEFLERYQDNEDLEASV